MHPQKAKGKRAPGANARLSEYSYGSLIDPGIGLPDESFLKDLPYLDRNGAEHSGKPVPGSGGTAFNSFNVLEITERGARSQEQPAIEPDRSCDEKIAFGSAGKCFLMLSGDVALLVLATMFSSWAQEEPSISELHSHIGPYALGIIFYTAALYVFDSYNMSRVFSWCDSALRIAVASLLGGLLSVVAQFLVLHWPYGQITPILQCAMALFTITAWRITYSAFFQQGVPKIRTLIIGAGKEGAFIHRLLNSRLSPYDVRGFLDSDPARHGKLVDASAVLGGIDQLQVIARKVWATTVILATAHNHHPEIIKRTLEARLNGLEVLEMATIYERLTGRVPVTYLQDEWLLFAEGFYLLSKEYMQRMKRLLDIFLSGILLALSFPLLGLAALLIRLDSPGPVLYRQERVGKKGKIFTIVKFRSMRTNAEADGAKWAEKNDPRVTRVGRVLRSLRLDELPQLWNIFKGEMSLVGPRPERPEFVRQLEAKIPYYSARHSIAPGVSGWAQINYSYGSSDEDSLIKLEYDLYYIKNMSILLDLKILLRTVGVVLLGQGAR